MPDNCMPCTVKALGESVHMTPLSWWEYPDRVVIVFVQGPKLTFYRDVEAEPVKEIEIQAQTPAKTRRPRKKK